MVKRGYHFPYKIGLISTHGTGKTTLVYDLAGEFKKKGYNVEVISEVATRLSKQAYPINQNTNLPAQFSILLSQMLEELAPTAKNHKCDIMIADRTVTTDNLIYLKRACGSHPFISQIEGFMMNYNNFFPYSKLYLLPLTGELKGDGVRDTDKAFQKDIYTRLTNFLDGNYITHEMLPVPNIKDKDRKKWLEIIVNNTMKDLRRK